MEGWECVVYPQIFVCEDTLLSSFPPIIYCMPHHFCPETAGVMMTNTALLSQTRILGAKKNKNLEHVTETLEDVNKKQLPVCFRGGITYQER